jgi:hypothetical protein
MTVLFERKSGAETEEGEDGRKRIEGSREKHIYMVKTDHTIVLQLKTRKLAGKYSSKASDLYPGSA